MNKTEFTIQITKIILMIVVAVWGYIKVNQIINILQLCSKYSLLF